MRMANMDYKSYKIRSLRGVTSESDNETVHGKDVALPREILMARGAAARAGEYVRREISMRIMSAAGFMDYNHERDTQATHIPSVSRMSSLIEMLDEDPKSVNERLHAAVKSLGIPIDKLRKYFPGSIISLSEVMRYSFPGIDARPFFISYLDLFNEWDMKAEMDTVTPFETYKRNALRVANSNRMRNSTDKS